MTLDFRSQDIVDIIKVADTIFPYRYFASPQNPKQRLYPSVEVDNEAPASPEKKVDVTKTQNRFVINIFQKYDGPRDRVTDALEDAEIKFLALLNGAILDADDDLTVGKTILETKNFQRGKIKDNPNNVNGVQSSLTVVITEVKPTEVGIALGAQNTVTIGTITDAIVYDKPTESESSTFESVYDRKQVRKRVVPITDERSFLFSIGWNLVRETELRTLKRLSAKISCTFIRNGVSEVKDGWIVDVSNGATFEGVETLVVQFEEVQ